MHSRAFLLLKRDLANIDRLPLEGITASPISDDDFYRWAATVNGLYHTHWEGGIFHLKLRFSDNYNTLPPTIQFMTIPYHPNVDPNTGIISMSLLREWNEEYSLSSLLLAIQVLLYDPDMESGCILNHEAAHHYLYAPHTYRQLVFDCVSASLRIQAGKVPYDSCDHQQHTSLAIASQYHPTKHPQRRLKKIPFDDYHVLWQGLATSVCNYNPNNEFMQLLAKDHCLNQVHFESELCKTGDLQKRTEDHLTLKYGISKKSKTSKPMTKEEKQKRIAELQAIYSNKVKSPLPPSTVDDDPVTSQPVNDLLAWTKTLDENELDNVL